MEHVAQQRQQDITPLDEDCQRLTQTFMPPPFPPTSSGSYLQSLLWWRSHYSETLRANATREYLQLVEREGPLLPITVAVHPTAAASAVSASSSFNARAYIHYARFAHSGSFSYHGSI
ncbi:hypothetical protein Y032_0603g539 [Ancylostoma ceylanicum]|uniref:Uncharacterized protein n=1 Tax=Ancylostoma ceylanicum TaxID=53326 RepID=A0A016WLZ1_9BILA|nr:hypothetical protein Y032_0603g539 [Ancylostoma ceylanicum]